MRKALILLAGTAALAAAPAFAQVGGVVGGTVDTTAQVGTGAVGDTLTNTTARVGSTVDRVDGTVNKQLDATKLTLATRDQVRAGAQVTDRGGNSVGTVQSIDGDNAIVVDGGKLYNIPLGSLYSQAEGATGTLVTKLPRADITARAQAGAEASTR
ncbi:MAG: hypothetical protein J0H88_04455 [Sphingomonadales bacterium]|nr:hypothetical protein [Sphingomonadales bacterium]